MNLHATKLAKDADSDAGVPDSPAASSPAGRFTYASGSKPLSGYTIKRGIGHGGFGEVYYATSDAGKEVALELIRRNWDVELRGVNHCLNLKHPNLLALFDVRQDEHDDNWVVMELMSGESLEDMLQRSPNGLPVEEALAWMHGLGAGVAYLHDHGIVHRDLKPGNVFVDEGIVKIGDYGLSKFISCSRRSGQTGSVGTVHYMAPEVANGRYGKEIDIYALGIILYEMLTGHVPFEGESVGEILMKHLTAEADVSRLAEPYRTIVARALAKDPAKRFASVEEMLAMLPPAPIGAALTASARYVAPSPTDIAQSKLPSAAAAYANLPLALDKPGESAPALPTPASDAANQQLSAEMTSADLSKQAGRIDDEPILRLIGQTWSGLVDWWERMNFQPWQKLLMLLGACFVAFNLMLLWLPVLIVSTTGYLVYRIVRLIVKTGSHSSLAATTQTSASASSDAQLAARRHALPLVWLVPILAPALLLGYLSTQAHTENHAREILVSSIMLAIPLGGLGAAALRFHWRKTATFLVLFSLGAAGTLVINWLANSGESLQVLYSWPMMFPIGIGFALVSFVVLSMIGLQKVGIHQWLPSEHFIDDDSVRQIPIAAATQPPSEPTLPESRTRRHWRQHSTMAYAQRSTPRERVTKLLESLLTSAAVVAVMSLVMAMLRGSAMELNQYAWLAATSLLGSWVVLIPAKLWETGRVDNSVRRFVMLVAGIAVGAVSYSLMQWLMVALTPDPKLMVSEPLRGLNTEFFTPEGAPRLIALVAYYGFVFVVMRWWKLADPVRNTRLSLWSVAVAVFWSFLINLFWPFPQPWGMMTAATIAVAVQMASPCVVKHRRAMPEE